jgi:ankyrin repeat protein
MGIAIGGALAAIGVVLLGIVVIGALISEPDQHGDPCRRSEDPLIRAAAGAEPEDVEAELDRGADPNRVDREGTALICAIEAAVPDGDGDDDVDHVDRRQLVAVIRRLLEGGADPDQAVDVEMWFRGLEGDPTPLLLAARHGQADVVGVLVEGGADPDLAVDESTPLEMAATYGHAEVVTILLAAGAHPDGATGAAEGDYGRPVERAASHGHIEVVDLLLASGAEARPSLIQAAAGGSSCVAEEERYASQHDMVEHLLVAHDADPDGGVVGPSPLLCAAWSGNEALAELLLDHGADPDHGGEVDRWLLTFALVVSDVPEMPPELEHALFPFLVDDRPPGLDTAHLDERVSNVPPLVAATWRGEAAIAERLLAAHADPDLGIGEGLNPLFAAVVRNRPWAVDLLLDHGAEPDPPRGSRPWTPADVAHELGNDQLADVLEGHSS